MFAVTIWSFGDFLLFVGIGLAIVIHCVRKYLAANTNVSDAAKKAVSGKAIDLIGKWLK